MTATTTTNGTATMEKRRYLPADVGKNAKGELHAFHVEGYIGRPADMRTTKNNQQVLSTSMGIGISPERLMALAEGTYQSGKDYGADSGFLELRLFGKLAEEFSAICDTGLRVAVSGKLERQTYTKKSGETGSSIVLMVNNIVSMGSKNKNKKAAVFHRLSGDVSVFKSKDGMVYSQPTAELIAGKVVGHPELRYGKSGCPYLAFGLKTDFPAEQIVDTAAGNWQKDKEYDQNKRIINVVVFKKAATALEKIVENGAFLLASGPVEVQEYNGNTSCQMRARVVSVIEYAPKKEQEAPAEADTTPADTSTSDLSDFASLPDEDEDLPF